MAANYPDPFSMFDIAADDLDFTDYSDGYGPSTLMGQYIEALNSQTNLDDIGLSLENFQGGLECNVDEVSGRKFLHELQHLEIGFRYRK